MRYKELPNDGCEFIYDHIPLGVITTSQQAFGRLRYRVRFYQWREHDKVFDTNERAKVYAESQIEPLKRRGRLPIEKKYIKEVQIPKLKQLAFKLANKQELFEEEVEIILGIGKELGGPTCSVCGSNKVRVVADNIVWCDECAEHREMKEMGTVAAPIKADPVDESIVIEKINKNVHRIVKGGATLGKIIRRTFNKGSNIYLVRIPGKPDKEFIGPDALEKAKEFVMEEMS